MPQPDDDIRRRFGSMAPLDMRRFMAGRPDLTPPTPGMSAYDPTIRDRIAAYLMGDTRPSVPKREFIEGIMGSGGLGNTGPGILDFTPAGIPLNAQETGRAIGRGDPVGAGVGALGLAGWTGAGGKVAKAIANRVAQEAGGGLSVGLSNVPGLAADTAARASLNTPQTAPALARKTWAEMQGRHYGEGQPRPPPTAEEDYAGDLAGGSPVTGPRGWRPGSNEPIASDPVGDAIRATNAANQGPSSAAYRRSSGPASQGVGGVNRWTIDPAVAGVWNKAGISTPDFVEGNPEFFRQSIVKAQAGSPFGAALKPREDYSNMRTFVTPDGKAGFALEGDDIVSVFNGSQGQYKNIVAPMMDLAVSQGGRTLDAYDTVLPHLYARSGFKPVARMPFSPREDWNPDAFKGFNEGKPDGVFMVYDPSHDGTYVRGSGTPVADYASGKAVQQAEKNRIASEPPEEQGTEAGRQMWNQMQGRAGTPNSLSGTWGHDYAGFPTPDPDEYGYAAAGR